MGAGIDMSLSKLSARCQACPFVDTCDNKEMEALGYLPLPEPSARPTEKEYRSVENLWDNPKMPIGSDPASGGMVSMGGKSASTLKDWYGRLPGRFTFPSGC